MIVMPGLTSSSVMFVALGRRKAHAEQYASNVALVEKESHSCGAMMQLSLHQR